jgi:hypothetical protein
MPSVSQSINGALRHLSMLDASRCSLPHRLLREFLKSGTGNELPLHFEAERRLPFIAKY